MCQIPSYTAPTTTQMRHPFCPCKRVLAAERLCELVLREQECLRRQLEALVREVGEIKEQAVVCGLRGV